MMTKEKAKELALISSYIVREDLLYGTVFQTFDIAYSLAEELTKECGYLPDNLPYFIAYNIDWKGVADDLKADYTEADYEGTTYYMRA